MADSSNSRGQEDYGFKNAAFGYDKNDVQLYIGTLKIKVENLEGEIATMKEEFDKKLNGGIAENVRATQRKLTNDYKSKIDELTASLKDAEEKNADIESRLAEYEEKIHKQETDLERMREIAMEAARNAPPEAVVESANRQAEALIADVNTRAAQYLGAVERYGIEIKAAIEDATKRFVDMNIGKLTFNRISLEVNPNLVAPKQQAPRKAAVNPVNSIFSMHDTNEEEADDMVSDIPSPTKPTKPAMAAPAPKAAPKPSSKPAPKLAPEAPKTPVVFDIPAFAADGVDDDDMMSGDIPVHGAAAKVAPKPAPKPAPVAAEKFSEFSSLLADGTDSGSDDEEFPDGIVYSSTSSAPVVNEVIANDPSKPVFEKKIDDSDFSKSLEAEDFEVQFNFDSDRAKMLTNPKEYAAAKAVIEDDHTGISAIENVFDAATSAGIGDTLDPETNKPTIKAQPTKLGDPSTVFDFDIGDNGDDDEMVSDNDDMSTDF